MLNDRDYAALVALFDGDEDRAKAWLTANPDAANRTISEIGAIARSTEDPPEADPEPDPVVELDDLAVDAIVGRMQETPAFQELLARIHELGEYVEALVIPEVEPVEEAVEKLETRLAALEKEDGEKQAEWVQDLPRRAHTQFTYRPRTQEHEPGSLADVAADTMSRAPRPKIG